MQIGSGDACTNNYLILSQVYDICDATYGPERYWFEKKYWSS